MGRVVVEVSFPLLVGWLIGAATCPLLTAEANPWWPLLWPPNTSPSTPTITLPLFIHASITCSLSHSYTADEIFSAWHLSSSNGSKFSRRPSRNGPLSP